MIAFYARVSSEKQADRGTIQSQIDYARKWFELNNISEYRLYADDGITGTLPIAQRPQGSMLMADVKAGIIDTLYIYKLDRLGRNTRVILNGIYDLEKNKVVVKSMTEPFDTSSAAGRFMLTMLSGVAELERSNILERLSLGKGKALAQNKWVYGLPPYGYRLNDDSTLRIEEPEAETVKWIFDSYLNQKHTAMKIANLLTATNVPLPINNLKKRIGRWRVGAIYAILRNKIYTGTDTNKLATLHAPQIIDNETFEKVQQQLVDNTKFNRKNARLTYQLSRLIQCKLCGRRFCGTHTINSHRGKTPYQLYHCNGKYASKIGADHEPCTAKSIGAKKIEAWAWDQLINYLHSHADVVASQKENPQKDMRVKIKKALKNTEQEKEKILDLYRLNILSLAELQDQLRKIDDARAALLDELNNVPVPVKPSQSPLIIKKKIMAIIDKNPDGITRQKIFRLAVRRVLTDGVNHSIEFNF